ncbi:sterol desaturase family [Verticillium dahliae]|nr:sterol desaturase family [Verticillium dahliae]
MTWTTLVLSHSALKIELVGTLGLRLVFWLLPSLVFLLFDTLIHTLASLSSMAATSALPPTDPVFLARTLGLSLVNLALAVGLEAGISIAWTTAFQTPISQPRPHPAVPGPPRALRAAATPWPPSKKHAQPPQRAAFSLLLFAEHPLPFLVHRVLPLYLPSLALRPHLLTYFLFVGLCTLEETLATKWVLDRSPGIMMGGITRRTAGHYAGGGRGNYGAWGLLDWAHGTSVGKNVIEDAKDEAEKHAVKERGEKAAGDGPRGCAIRYRWAPQGE